MAIILHPPFLMEANVDHNFVCGILPRFFFRKKNILVLQKLINKDEILVPVDKDNALALICKSE